MTYDVQIGSGGYIGWKILEQTMPLQRSTFLQDPSIISSRDYFAKKMPEVVTAEQLVADFKLLTVTLRAFGLDADINNKYFIKEVLESDPDDQESLVNRLADKRYLKMSQALSFHADGQAGAAAVETILESYDTRSFEKSIGQQHAEIELALNAQRELAEIAGADISENAKWYQVLASEPLRQIFEGAYQLDDSFGALPIDRQLTELKSRSEKLTGSSSVSQFQSDDALERILQRFLLLGPINAAPVSSRYANALALLTS